MEARGGLDEWCTANISTQTRYSTSDKVAHTCEEIPLKDSDITCMAFKPPLRIYVSPRDARRMVKVVYLSRRGGRMAAGTNSLVTVTAGDFSGVLVCTAAACVVEQGEEASHQILQGRGGHHSLLAYTPDPHRLSSGSRLSHHVLLELESTSSVILIDWLVAPTRRTPPNSSTIATADDQRQESNDPVHDFSYNSSVSYNIKGENLFSDKTTVDGSSVTIENYSVFGWALFLGPIVTVDAVKYIRRIVRSRGCAADAVKCWVLKRQHDTVHGCYVKFACQHPEDAEDLLSHLLAKFHHIRTDVYRRPDD